MSFRSFLLYILSSFYSLATFFGLGKLLTNLTPNYSDVAEQTNKSPWFYENKLVDLCFFFFLTALSLMLQLV